MSKMIQALAQAPATRPLVQMEVIPMLMQVIWMGDSQDAMFLVSET